MPLWGVFNLVVVAEVCQHVADQTPIVQVGSCKLCR